MTDSNRTVAVSAHRDGFRRAGKEWTVQPRSVAVVPDAEIVRDPRPLGADEITESDLLLLERDANIAVVEQGVSEETLASAVDAHAAQIAEARVAHVATAILLAPEDAPRTQGGELTIPWLQEVTGLAGVTSAEREAATPTPPAD